MVRALLIRGMLAGLLASMLAFGFAKAVGEPPIERAIAIEEQMERAMSGAHGHEHDAMPELVSREVQSGLGLATGVGVFGTAVGGLFALVFAFAYGRVGRFGARTTSALLALAAFIAIVLVPFLKYPANPPGIGGPSTIGIRTALYFAMIAVSLGAMVSAVQLARWLTVRAGAWHAGLAGAALFIGIVTLALGWLPVLNEVPEHFPADLLWRFRLASLGIQAVLWAALGLSFGPLAERLLERSSGGRHLVS
jgi:hypothetical protein